MEEALACRLLGRIDLTLPSNANLSFPAFGRRSERINLLLVNHRLVDLPGYRFL